MRVSIEDGVKVQVDFASEQVIFPLRVDGRYILCRASDNAIERGLRCVIRGEDDYRRILSDRREDVEDFLRQRLLNYDYSTNEKRPRQQEATGAFVV